MLEVDLHEEVLEPLVEVHTIGAREVCSTPSLDSKVFNSYKEYVEAISDALFCPTFNIGCNTLPAKRCVKIKKQGNAISKCIKGLDHMGCVGPKNTINLDPSSKRKSWDSDIVMEDCEWDLKRSCMGSGVALHFSESVADVGESQSREQE